MVKFLYIKDTRLDNPEIEVQDERIVELDEIVKDKNGAGIKFPVSE